MTINPVSMDESPGVAVADVSRLPVPPATRSLTLAYVASGVIAFLLATASIAGLLYADTLYPTQEMRLLKQPTDLFTLVVALPLLLLSMWLARRGKVLGLLLWPGMLVYVLYIYVSYAIGVPLSALFPVYLALVTLSAYTTIALLASIDAPAVRQRLEGRVPARGAAGILTVLAVLFTIMNLSAILAALDDILAALDDIIAALDDIIAALGDPVPGVLLNFPVWIADFTVMAPLWLLGGILLWQRKPLGYVAGTGLYLLGSLLFLGLICFVPLALFMRASVESGRDSSPAKQE